MGYRFYGWEHADAPAKNDLYEGIKTPRDLYDALAKVWCAETCAPRMRAGWTPENPTLGQCSITAFLAQDIFGGKVYGVPLPDGNFHCYNAVGGCIFDLTSEQFGDRILSYENNPRQLRETHFAKEEKRLRYEDLKRRLKKQIDDLKNLAEVRTDSAEIYDGVILHVYRDTVRLPNGRSTGREVIRHVGAVGILPLTEDGKVVIERQYRYPLDQVITEIPAGKLESRAEDRLAAAKRELKEETGITADTWIDLGVYYPAAAYTDEKITLYLARDLHFGKQNLDDDEFLDVGMIPLKELVDKVMSGEITDGKTQVAILKAARYLYV